MIGYSSVSEAGVFQHQTICTALECSPHQLQPEGSLFLSIIYVILLYDWTACSLLSPRGLGPQTQPVSMPCDDLHWDSCRSVSALCEYLLPIPQATPILTWVPGTCKNGASHSWTLWASSESRVGWWTCVFLEH